MLANPLRSLPSVNDLLDSPPLRRLSSRLSGNIVVSMVRPVLEEMREEVYTAASERACPA